MVLLSDVAATKKRHRFTQRTWNGTDVAYIAFMVAMHGLCLLAPATFSWHMVALFAASYLVTGCLGITLSFHRQLSHKAFVTPKWLEYALAYCGVLAVQARGSTARPPVTRRLRQPTSFLTCWKALGDGVALSVGQTFSADPLFRNLSNAAESISRHPVTGTTTAGRPDGVGVQPPLSSSAHRHAA